MVAAVTFVISRLLLVFFANSIAYSSGFYVLWTCAHAFAMRQRKVLDDNEWAGWLQWMTAFQNFVNTEIVGAK